MPDIVTDGQNASASVVTAAFAGLQSIGQSVLDDITTARNNLLIGLELNLEGLNGKRGCAARVGQPALAGSFRTSDFVDIDQAQTTATVRANTMAVTLRERNIATNAVIRTTTFRSDRGTVTQANGVYRVNVTDGSVPLGVFELELTEALNISLVTFDILSMPASPAIVVRTSPNNVAFAQALEVSQAGYQVTAWLAPASVKFIRLEITPSHPDTLGGPTYSFGITDLAASAVSFNLLSEFVTRAVTLTPASANLRFVADVDDNLTYFLSWDGGSFFQVHNGDLVPIPGSAAAQTIEAVTLNQYGQLGANLPANVYQGKLKIQDAASGASYRLAPGLQYPPQSTANSYMMLPAFPAETPIFLAPYSAPDIPPIFNISYETGPATLPVYLRVQLTTNDSSTTPVFHGASLENT